MLDQDGKATKTEEIESVKPERLPRLRPSPNHLHLPVCLRSFGLIKAFGMLEYAASMDANLSWPGDWCAGLPVGTALPAVSETELRAALQACPLGAANAAAAVHGLSLLLEKYRQNLTENERAAPEPCGAIRMPTSYDR